MNRSATDKRQRSIEIDRIGRKFAHFDAISRVRALTDRESRAMESALQAIDQISLDGHGEHV